MINMLRDQFLYNLSERDREREREMLPMTPVKFFSNIKEKLSREQSGPTSYESIKYLRHHDIYQEI